MLMNVYTVVVSWVVIIIVVAVVVDSVAAP